MKEELNELKEGMTAVSDKNIPRTWEQEAWGWVKKEGITDGTNPQSAVTREQVITMLYRYHERVTKK